MSGNSVKLAGLSLCSLLVACLVIPAAAAADFHLVTSGVGLTAADGSASRQAGAHPDIDVRFSFGEKVGPNGTTVVPDGNVRDVDAALPPGVVGNPTAAPTCRWVDFLQPIPACPIASKVGFARVISEPGRGGDPDAAGINEPVYNMEHGDDVPAVFAFQYVGAAVKIVPQVRPGDYGITASSRALSEALPVFGADVTLWGVPADPSHDALRGGPSPDDRKPLLSAPTSCPGSPSKFSIGADSWQNPGAFVSQDIFSDLGGEPFVTTGCDRVPFDPAVTVQPTSRRAGQPTGLDVDLTVPQNEHPDGLASADVRRTVVTLPQGMSISTAAAAGLGACSPAQIGIGSNDPPACPDASKIGTVKIKTPLLSEELEGDVILAKQRENPFGSLLAMYLAVKGPGFYLKLPGKVEADPVTGQLTTTFDNNPQLPFERLQLALRDGPTAPLVAPADCGSYVTRVRVTSWASAVPIALDSPMTIDAGCATNGFAPKLDAGTVSARAGRASPFFLRVTRQDGEQNISRIQATLPEGALAKLAGVPLCAEAQAVTGDCPPASQVGTTTVGAGAGSNPLYVPQPGKAPTAVYLSGPYKGAPYSLVVKVPAQAGPFDLGNVVVRNALNVDPVTHQGHGDLRSLAPDPRRHPAELPRRQGRNHQARLHDQSDLVRSDERELDDQLDRRQDGKPVLALPGHQLRRPWLQATAEPESQWRDQAPLLPIPEGGPDPAQGPGQHRQGRGHPAALGVLGTGPHRHRLHPGAVRRRRLPEGEHLRHRHGDHAIARQAPQWPGLPQKLQPPTAGPRRFPARSYRRRPLRPHRLGKGRHQGQLRNGP